VILFRFFCFDTGSRINIDTTELLAAFPAPGTTTTCVKDKRLAS